MNNHTGQQLEQASQNLFQAYSNHTNCEPIRNLIGDTDLATAYKIQKKFNQLIDQSNNGNSLIGRKVGVTALAAQQSFSISHPVYGSLFQNMELQTNQHIDFRLFYQPKIEVEIAFILKKNITSSISIAQLIQAIDWVAPAFEIVGSRMNWDVKITDMVADNIGASHFVLGHDFKRINQVDFVNCEMQLANASNNITKGSGAACLGSPINSLHWLANELVRVGEPLQSGETIIAGSLMPMIPIKSGDHLKASITGLGKVEMYID